MIQCVPLNGITDNGISPFMESNLSTLTKLPLSYLMQVKAHLLIGIICLTESVIVW